MHRKSPQHGRQAVVQSKEANVKMVCLKACSCWVEGEKRRAGRNAVVDVVRIIEEDAGHTDQEKNNQHTYTYNI